MPTRLRGRGAPAPTSPIHLVRELTMPLVFVLVVLYLLFGILTMEIPSNADFPGPRFFPSLVAAVIAVLAVIQTLHVFRAWRSGTLVHLGEDEDRAPADGDLTIRLATTPTARLRAFGWTAGSFLVFALVLPYLGWVIAGGLLFWGVARGMGSRRVLLDLVIGLTLSSLAYIGFAMLLGLPLPSGILGGGF